MNKNIFVKRRELMYLLLFINKFMYKNKTGTDNNESLPQKYIIAKVAIFIR